MERCVKKANLALKTPVLGLQDKWPAQKKSCKVQKQNSKTLHSHKKHTPHKPY